MIAPRPTLVTGSVDRDVQDDDWKVRIADDGTIVVHRKKNGAAPIKLEFVLTGPGAPLIPTQILFFADSPDATSAFQTPMV